MPFEGGPFDVVAIDDQDVVRGGLATLPQVAPDVVRTIRVVEHPDRLDLSGPAPDVVVLDFWLERDSEACTPYIAGLKEWGAAVLLFTNEERPGALRDAVSAGIDGLCLKGDGMAALVRAIARAGAGQVAMSGPLARTIAEQARLKSRLTPRQAEVLMGLSLGLTDQEIAERLSIAPKTVGRHIGDIFDIYREVTQCTRMNRTRIVHEAIRRGDLPDPWRSVGGFSPTD